MDIKLTPEQADQYRRLAERATAAEAALGGLQAAIAEARDVAPAPWRGRPTAAQKREDSSVEGLQRRLQGAIAAPAAYHAQLQREAELVVKKAQQDAEAAKRAEQAKLQGAEQRRLENAAVQWLLNKGKVLGVDFDVSDAVNVANDIAAEEEAARLIAAGGPYDFDGQNCDGYGEGDDWVGCSGWDGDSRRCNCGNRRVSWQPSWDHSFEHPSLRGEAY